MDVSSKTILVSMMCILNKYDDVLFNEKLLNNMNFTSYSFVYKHYEKVFKEFTYKVLSSDESSEGLKLVMDMWDNCKDGVKFIFDKKEKKIMFYDYDKNHVLVFVLNIKTGISIKLVNNLNHSESKCIDICKKESLPYAKSNSYSMFYNLTKHITVYF